MNDRIYSLPFRNSRADTQTAHHLRSYGLSQLAAISLATRDLAAEGQRSSSEIPFNGDYLVIHNDARGQDDYARIIFQCEYFFLLLAATGKLDRHFTVLWDHGHIKFWSHKTMREVLTETGFTHIKFSGAGRIPWLWKSMVVRAEKRQ